MSAHVLLCPLYAIFNKDLKSYLLLDRSAFKRGSRKHSRLIFHPVLIRSSSHLSTLLSDLVLLESAFKRGWRKHSLIIFGPVLAKSYLEAQGLRAHLGLTWVLLGVTRVYWSLLSRGALGNIVSLYSTPS